MKALVLDKSGLSYRPDHEMPLVIAGEVLVKVTAAALNHRDQFIREGRYAGIRLPVIPGSDGVGTVDTAVGMLVPGSRVIINPSIGWGDNPEAQGPVYQILGMPRDGTMAEYISIPADRLHECPPHLSDEQGAALPLCGLTAYRALFVKGQVSQGQRVLVTGIGGGVSTMVMLLSKAAGAKVWVTSRHQDKILRALSLGATGGFVIDDADAWADVKKAGPFDVVVDSVGGSQFNYLTEVVERGGRIIVYGASAGAVPTMNMHRVFWKQITVVGSTMGTDEDFAAMVSFVNEYKVVPVVDSVVNLDDGVQAFDKLADAEQFGKVVLRCA